MLVGDLFYARFFQEISGLPGTGALVRQELLDAFLTVTARMCQGEILEEGIRSAGRDATIDEYLGITEAKTASLLAACCRAGALIGGGTAPMVRGLDEYGSALGLLFQIADDLSDGDAAFPSHMVLRAKAADAAEAACAALAAVRGGPAGAALGELAGFLRERATKESFP